MLRLGSMFVKLVQKPKRLPFARFLNQAAPKTETNTKDFVKMSYKSSNIFVGSGLLLLSYFYYEKGQLEKQREASKNESVGKPLVGGPFTLVDHNGTPVTNLSYKGKYMLIYFGYTVL
jgi:protein SCO1/2